MCLSKFGSLMVSTCALTSTVAHATKLYPRVNASSPWFLERFSNFIVFGDSYTDESRLGYFINNNGSGPPPGTVLPESTSASDGGRIWARYVIQYTGADVNGAFQPALSLFDYAVSGAVCSNLESPRYFSAIKAPFPDLELYEVPAFIADSKFVNETTNSTIFDPPLSASNGVYAIFDGTNDLGNYAYLTDSQVPGDTLATYSDCIFSQVDKLYANGARFFVMMNLFPLDLAPQYSNTSAGGLPATQYWPDKSTDNSNITLWNQKMSEYVATANQVYQYRTPYEVAIGNRYPGANFAVFDVHSLITDIYYNPSAYLNGSAPLNVTGYVHHCSLNGTDCVANDSPDSFLWYDELHPSEQTQRTLAREFVNVISGNSSYASYY